jgi:hypothetical protein
MQIGGWVLRTRWTAVIGRLAAVDANGPWHRTCVTGKPLEKDRGSPLACGHPERLLQSWQTSTWSVPAAPSARTRLGAP